MTGRLIKAHFARIIQMSLVQNPFNWNADPNTGVSPMPDTDEDNEFTRLADDLCQAAEDTITALKDAKPGTPEYGLRRDLKEIVRKYRAAKE